MSQLQQGVCAKNGETAPWQINGHFHVTDEKRRTQNICNVNIFWGGGGRTPVMYNAVNALRKKNAVHPECKNRNIPCGGAVGWGTALQVGSSRVRFPMVSLEFFVDIILVAALWPWGRFSLRQKWVPGVKGGRRVRLTNLPPSCADCLEIWEPQPPGTLRTSPGL